MLLRLKFDSKVVKKPVISSVTLKTSAHCGACVSMCPVEAINLTEDGNVEFLDNCVLCGNCVKVCPVKALSIPV